MKNRKTKLVYILILVLSIVAMSIGFAAFSSSLNLIGDATVKPNAAAFGVKFSSNINSMIEDDIVPNSISVGLTSSNGVIDNSGSPKLTNLSVNFTSPGQYVEYIVFARNEGEYNAYLNSVNFYEEKICTAGEGASEFLVSEACNAINMKVTIANVEYTETTLVTDHVLNKGTGEEVRLKIEYDPSSEAVDGDFSVEFPDLILVYSTINDSTYIPPTSELSKIKLLDVIKENAISDIGVNFKTSPTAGTYIRQGTENDSNPIYYYRGAVTNNNIKFAGFCWKIVRTTDTGGVKLIYNGIPSVETGSCNNTGTTSQFANTSAFNSNFNSPADVGYMYGTRYTTESINLSSQTDTYIYGNDVTWDGSKYTLIDTIESSNWATDRTNIAKRYHYTCFSTTNTCTNIYYINHFGDSSKPYYLTLAGGKDIEQAKEEMFTNSNNSNIKLAIDNWYSTNMEGYTSKLEDTVWCNERNFYNGSLKSKDTEGGTSHSYFEVYGRNVNSVVPNLSCSSIRDSFTVDGAIGNGKLTYPVGLLTADEITLAGSGRTGYSTSSYLNTGQHWWSLSPYFFSSSGGNGCFSFYILSSGYLGGNVVVAGYGIRPAISLRAGIKISGGSGSVEDSYIVAD